MYTVAVDLGKRKSQVAVFEEDGELHSEFKMANQKEGFVRLVRKLREPVQVVCETGNKCFWPADLMTEAGAEMHVANAYKVKLIAEARIKTDKVDARLLGQLLRAKFLPEVYVVPKEIRDWRELLRGRSFLVRIRTQLYNRIHAVLDRYGEEYETSQIHRAGAGAWIESLSLPEPIRGALGRYLEVIGKVTEHLKGFEKDLWEKVKTDEKARQIVGRLETIPGIGRLTALALYLELVDIKRFAEVKKLCGYIGIVPGVHQSGEVHRGGRLTKQGNALLRWMITEAAWSAVLTTAYYKQLHQRHARRIGASRAILPVARTLLAVVYRVWSEKKTYEELYIKPAAR